MDADDLRPGQRAVLDAISGTQPMDRWAIAKATGLSPGTVKAYVEDLIHIGRAHVHHWRFGGKRQLRAMYWEGGGTSCPRPKTLSRFVRLTVPEKLGELAVAMRAGDRFTTGEIATRFGVDISCGKAYIKRLRERHLIYIAEWRRGKQGPIRQVWAWGQHEDAKKPPNLTPPERCARWRKTERGQEQKEAYNKAAYARRKVEQLGVAAIDPLLAIICKPSSTK